MFKLQRLVVLLIPVAIAACKGKSNTPAECKLIEDVWRQQPGADNRTARDAGETTAAAMLAELTTEADAYDDQAVQFAKLRLTDPALRKVADELTANAREYASGIRKITERERAEGAKCAVKTPQATLLLKASDAGKRDLDVEGTKTINDAARLSAEVRARNCLFDAKEPLMVNKIKQDKAVIAKLVAACPAEKER